ncbi:hypothetical protein [Streptomyces sp. HPF1205]|uniref:hypothetical protein n=1 Tax=Streptomyces sp. HPF1205 TaxID=2873262 RepID=UPI001CECF6BA|nr:hypothetical protein [Streptomyces sp. HPF1205]
MPRGRHRHSQPLHRLLPPLTVAACAVAFAAAAFLLGDTGVIRALTAATAVAACVGAALARTWDRSAGREVADLTAARVRDEWRTDERVAELETDLEESREIRGRLEKKLRGKRAELARLRTEHADLLRRYATAESERARALEARRRLQIEGAAGQQLALTTGAKPVGPAAYLKAAEALKSLSRNGARQQAQRTVEEARRREAAAPEEPQGRHAADGAAPAAPDPGAAQKTPAGLPVREHRLVPAVAAAVLPYAQPARPANASGNRAIGGFDFFGTHKRPALPALSGGTDGPAPAPEAEAGDGAETGPGAEAGARPARPEDRGPAPGPAREHDRAAAPEATASEVIDLTAHDDTEQLDMRELRAKA